MSDLLDRLRGLSAAEDFFALLDVEYDPAVLNVARLHILRRMGQYLKAAPVTSEDDCRATLVKAYNDFVESTPLEQRVFKVLKDAVSPSRAAFVSLSDITVED